MGNLIKVKVKVETFNGETSRYWRVREVRLLKAKKSKLQRLEMKELLFITWKSDIASGGLNSPELILNEIA